jgi:hypothetical protein
MTSIFDDRKILSKNQRRKQERSLGRSIASFVGKRVNLTLRDESVIINVLLERPIGKRILRYRVPPKGEIKYLPIFELELITSVPLEVEWLNEVS